MHLEVKVLSRRNKNLRRELLRQIITLSKTLQTHRRNIWLILGNKAIDLENQKVYKEDTIIFDNDYIHLNDKDGVNLVKNKSVDDRKRNKTMKKIKSMKMNERDVFIEDPCFFSNIMLPGAGGKLDTIYNKTLSML